MGAAISRSQIEFSDVEIQRIGDTFRAWCNGEYENIDGFCKSAIREEISKNNDSLSPGRYIGTEVVDSESSEDFDTRMSSLTSELSKQLVESRRLEEQISEHLGLLGYDI
jgi:type I restriction enzyme M protein